MSAKKKNSICSSGIKKEPFIVQAKYASQYALLNLSHVATSTSFTAEFPIHLEPENEPENELL